MIPLSPVILFCGICTVVFFPACAEDNPEMDKRYIAALAKNGRLPKFAQQKKDDGQQEESAQSLDKEETEDDYSKDTLSEDKRHIGAFLKAHGRPFTRSGTFDDSDREEKRNIASMARLGRLNNYHVSRYQPYSVGGKRMSSEEVSKNDEDNVISLFEDPDCIETGEIADNDGNDRLMWMKKKRYVAALARSGRLPAWASQRMWPAGKRVDSRPYWSSTPIETSLNDNVLDDMPFIAAKNKKCKKVYDYQMGKRNIASLARNGKLPFRPNA